MLLSLLYELYVVQIEGVQYTLRVCSTEWGYAGQTEGVQYRLGVCRTD